jgi:hypothetical protein
MPKQSSLFTDKKPLVCYKGEVLTFSYLSFYIQVPNKKGYEALPLILFAGEKKRTAKVYRN